MPSIIASEKIYDAIVVGSGAAGSMAARTLALGGLNVLILEAGPLLSRDADFYPPNSKDYFSTLPKRLVATFRGQSVQAHTSTYANHTRHLFVNDRDNPYSTPAGKPYRWIRGRQVGGRLHVWGRLSLRFSDMELHSASRDGVGDDWPIDYSDIAPFYDRVEELMGVYGNPDHLPQLPDGRYRGSRNLTHCESDFRLKISRCWPERRVVCARIMQMRQDPLPLALFDAIESGKATLRPNSIVSSVSTNPNSGQATGVSYIDRTSGSLRHSRARMVVLCASAFESVRLLLNSASDKHPKGIGGGTDNLGRYIMDHTFYIANGQLPRDARVEENPGSNPYDFASSHGFYIPRYHNLTHGESKTTRGFGICGCIGRGGPWWWMGAFGEMLAHRNNRLSLDPGKRDAWGIPAAHIDLKWNRDDVALAIKAKNDIHDMMNEARLPWSSKRDFRGRGRYRSGRAADQVLQTPGLSVHEMGGARMGNDPEKSVVDRDGRCWESQNVIVADAACFTSGGYQNPALTIMALAMRAAERALVDFDSIAY